MKPPSCLKSTATGWSTPLTDYFLVSRQHDGHLHQHHSSWNSQSFLLWVEVIKCARTFNMNWHINRINQQLSKVSTVCFCSKDYKRVTLLVDHIFHLGIQESISPAIVGKAIDHFGMFCYVIEHQVLAKGSRFKMSCLKTFSFSPLPFVSTTHLH